MEWLQANLQLSTELQARLLGSLAIVVSLWLARLVLVYLVNRRTEDIRRQYRWRKATSYGAVLLGALLIGRLWLEGLQTVATFLGLLAAGLAIALQDPVTNLAGWVFILWRRPFEVGDRVQIGEHAGDVVDVRIFTFTLLEIRNWVGADQSTGRIMYVPNRKVFSEVLANYGQAFQHIWNEVPVLVTFESDWQQAKAILQEIADRHAAHLSADAEQRVRRAARRFMIAYATLTPTVYTRVAESGVLLTIRYLCEPRSRRTSEQAIWEDILRAFAAQPDIEFAYPTRRLYVRPGEQNGVQAF